MYTKTIIQTFRDRWWAHFSTSFGAFSCLRGIRRGSDFGLPPFQHSLHAFQKVWGGVLFKSDGVQFHPNNYRLYRRFFVVIFWFVVLFCRLTKKTDHCAFGIYLYSPLEFLWRDLLQKYSFSIRGVCKVSKVLVIGHELGDLPTFLFCLAKTVSPKRGLYCSGLFLVLAFFRIPVSTRTFAPFQKSL